MPEYTPEQLWKLYEKLPEALKNAILSSENVDDIFNICTRNEIGDEQISEIARYTSYVLLGVLPPEDFQKTLEKELKLKKEVAKKITHEINRFIFYPVKDALSSLYKRGVTLPEKPPEVAFEIKPPEKKPDIYREPIE